MRVDLPNPIKSGQYLISQLNGGTKLMTMFPQEIDLVMNILVRMTIELML